MSDSRNVWNAVYWRAPMTVRAALGLLFVPAAMLALQLRDCLKHGWWPRSTADAALFCMMLSAVVFVVGTFVHERRRARQARHAGRDRVRRRG